MNPLDQKKARNTEDDIDGGITEIRDLRSRGSVPKLLKNSAGGERCCIFRIPRRPENSKKDYYEPSVVSIGPYHHGARHLEMIQEHKHRFLELFMDEARKKDVEIKDLIEAVSRLEDDIMDSYSENLDLADGFDRNKLIDMMVLDGCFILMLFFVATKKVHYTRSDHDPIFRMGWILPAIRKDLLLLENQVPFFVLQTIFDKSKIVTSSGLNKVTFEFFGCLDTFHFDHLDIKAKHLLDLIRKTLVPPLKPSKANQNLVSRPFLKLIRSANDLQLRGICFKVRDRANTFLDVELKMEKEREKVLAWLTSRIVTTLEIPPIMLNDFLISIFRNCVAFEQYYGGCTNSITSYITFLGCLIRDKDDAKFLSDRGILENYFGMGEEISKILKVIGKDISFFDINESYLAEVFEGINEQAANEIPSVSSRERVAELTSLQSLSIAFMALVLTVVQVYLAVKEKK